MSERKPALLSDLDIEAEYSIPRATLQTWALPPDQRAEVHPHITRAGAIPQGRRGIMAGFPHRHPDELPRQPELKSMRKLNTHFERLNRLVDGGHLVGLSPSSIAVLMVMIRAQDKSGDSFYSLDHVSRLIGHSKRSVIRAMDELTSKGIIELRKGGIGRGNRAVRRILLQPVKGDTRVTVSGQQKVTPVTVKGDTGDQQKVTPVSKPVNHTLYKEQHTEQNKEQHRARVTRFAPESIDLPTSLKTPEFASAWGRWCAFRAELKKRLTPASVKQQLKDLEAWGVPGAIESIDASIRNGWQGLFEPKGKSKAKKFGEYDEDAPLLPPGYEESVRKYILEEGL